jgi:uncharacterized protein
MQNLLPKNSVMIFNYFSHKKTLFTLIFSIALLNVAKGQNNLPQQLIASVDFTQHKYDKREIRFLTTKSKNVFVRYNPLSLGLGSMMFFYQKIISEQLSTNCPYEINCSNFSKKMMREYGLFKGIALTADRLTRCTPFTVIDLTAVNLSPQNKIIDPVESYRVKK